MNTTHTPESLAAEIEAYARTWPQKAPLSDALYGYAAAVRALAQPERQEPTTERPQQWEFCHVRRPSAHEFAEAIGRMRNDGWEFDTQPIASPSADGDRLWLAFLRRPASRAVAAPDAELVALRTRLEAVAVELERVSEEHRAGARQVGSEDRGNYEGWRDASSNGARLIRRALDAKGGTP